jgi:hypothetical protein
MKTSFLSYLGVVVLAAPFSPLRGAAPTWEDDIRPIFKSRCLKCHGEEEQKADLSLHTLGAALKGGSSGEVFKKGRPNSSLLVQSIEHADGVEKMPPKSPKMPEDEIELIRQWILAGMPAGAGNAPEASRVAFVPAAAGKRPEKPAMPPGQPAEDTKGGLRNPVTALASSPWAPLVAMGAQGQVRFFHAETKESLGALPFPEGTPEVLRFSRDGALLLVAGGKPVQSGKAVIYEVATGKRLGSFGDESDTVLAADWSGDGRWVALGGPGKVVKVFRISDGQMAYKLSKHTDWITALEFSPDGKRLVTGDRSGGIHVWEAESGAMVLSLSEHKESIHALAWRPDGKVVASGSEDGSVILWGIEDGFPLTTLSKIHTPRLRPGEYGKKRGGVLGLAWTVDGNLLTTGRDGSGRMWSSEGGKVAESGPLGVLPSRVVGTCVGKRAVIGDARGGLVWWEPGS